MQKFPPISYSFNLIIPDPLTLLLFGSVAVAMLFVTFRYFEGRKSGISLAIRYTFTKVLGVKFLYGRLSLGEVQKKIGSNYYDVSYVSPTSAVIQSVFYAILALLTLLLSFVSITAV